MVDSLQKRLERELAKERSAKEELDKIQNNIRTLNGSIARLSSDTNDAKPNKN